MAQISTGSNTAGKANVDANYNLNVVTPTTESQAGFVALSSEIDAGTVTGVRVQKAFELSNDYRARSGLDTPMLNLSFEGTIVPQAIIQQNLTTMTAAQASGFFALNSGNATASGNAANIRTYRTFPLFGSFVVYADMWLREGNATATNAISEWGLGYVTGVAAPTDGVFFRRLSGGQLRAVVSFAGTETTADITTTNVPPRDGSGSYDPAEVSHYLISLNNDEVDFWINDVLVARILCPSAQGAPTSSSSLPMFARVYNSGVASAGRRIELGFIGVTQGDANMGGKLWSSTMAGMGFGSVQNPPGVASGSTANWANSAAPVSATLSNTAAGYTTLGGQWQAAAVVGAETDYALFAYQVPVGSATLPGKTLYVTGIRIGETFVQGAAVATSTVFVWGVGVGSTAVSLATADGAATVGPRRKVLGAQSIAAGAAIGSLAVGFERQFETPLVAPPGTFVHIILKIPQGAATASLVFRGSVDVNGHFE